MSAEWVHTQLGDRKCRDLKITPRCMVTREMYNDNDGGSEWSEHRGRQNPPSTDLVGPSAAGILPILVSGWVDTSLSRMQFAPNRFTVKVIINDISFCIFNWQEYLLHHMIKDAPNTLIKCNEFQLLTFGIISTECLFICSVQSNFNS
jgi:hypothetical protein